jgi:hypothetical protein
MTALLKTGGYFLLFSFRGLPGPWQGPSKIALGIGIRDTYINDAVCAAFPEAANKQVSSAHLCFAQVAGNWGLG